MEALDQDERLDSRNRLLEQLTAMLRRREATAGEVEVLVVVCRPTWAKVARSLRRYGGVPSTPQHKGRIAVKRLAVSTSSTEVSSTWLWLHFEHTRTAVMAERRARQPAVVASSVDVPLAQSSLRRAHARRVAARRREA